MDCVFFPPRICRTALEKNFQLPVCARVLITHTHPSPSTSEGAADGVIVYEETARKVKLNDL